MRKVRHPKYSTQDVERFYSRVSEVDDNGCWLWNAVARDGYGRFWGDGILTTANRASWIIHHGNIPGALLVCHRCDNPRCVNPSHMFLGSERDNAWDAIAKGRWAHYVKPFCSRGHPMSGDNVYVSRLGRRACRACWGVRRRARALAA